MQERRLNIGFAFFPYGGNGATSSEVPDTRDWLIPVVIQCNKDPRIDKIFHKNFSDTPITMTRNQSVTWAQESGADILVMIDSDMKPDCEADKDPNAKPFFPTSFDFLYDNWDKGPNVVCAPYCGPPPNEIVYCFYWETMETDDPNPGWALQKYSRNEAMHMAGIQPCAAQPTGLIMYDMRAFDLIGKPYFYYEYSSDAQDEKDSTEDVTNTRDISMHGHLKCGRDTIFINWDAWAGHWKPKCVGKPRGVYAETISAKYTKAALQNQKYSENQVFVGANETPTEGRPVIEWNSSKIRRKRQLEELSDNKVTAAEAREIDTVMTDPNTEFVEGMQDDGIIRYGHANAQRDLDALETLVRETGVVLAVEVGSWTGDGTLAIARGLNEGGGIICVDHWTGSPNDGTSDIARRFGADAIFKAFLENTESIRHKVHILYMSSIEAAKSEAEMGYNSADFIYLDADHSYESVKADIEAWLPHVKVGGVIAGHDFHRAFPGLRKAVEERFGTAAKVAHDGETLSSVWHVKVTKAIKDGQEQKDKAGDNGRVHERDNVGLDTHEQPAEYAGAGGVGD